jgi:hypothetical protein
MGFVAPSPQDKADLIDLGEDLIEAWSANSGSDGEYFDSANHKWVWDSSVLASPNPFTWEDLKMGASALAAVVYRVKRPRDIAFRQRYRYLAIDTIDGYFANQTDSSGFAYRNGVADGQASIFALANIFIAAKALNIKDRWRTRVLAMVDRLTTQGELTYYINGNFQLSKACCYAFAAWISDNDPDRVADFETAIEFAYTPALVEPGSWPGYGWIEEEPFEDELGTGGKGYFSETPDSSPSLDVSGDNRFDNEYTILQCDYAAVGYLMTGDARFARACVALTNKLYDYWDHAATNLIDCTGGSRHLASGTYYRGFVTPTMAIGRWMLKQPYADSDIALQIPAYIADYRTFLNQTHVNYWRGAGIQVATWIIAAHGLPLGEVTP